MNKKTLLIGLLAAWPFACAFGFAETERNAIQATVDAAVADLAQSAVPKTEGLLVLPIRGDQDGYAESLLKGALAAAGFKVVEPPDQSVWNRILAEIEWTERKEDILDPDTVVKFGDMEGAKTLVYGRLVDVNRTAERTFAELLLHASSIATRRQIWGNVFAKSEYLTEGYAGLVGFDRDSRAVLAAVMAQLAESIRSSAKLPEGMTVAMVPLAGDQDGFVSAMVRDVVAATTLKPVDLGVRTSAQAREKSQESVPPVQAVLNGAVRDLYSVDRSNPTRRAVEIGAAIQVDIRNAASGEILWSGTFDETQLFSETIPWWAMLLAADKKIWLYAGAGLLGFILILKFLKATQRVR